MLQLGGTESREGQCVNFETFGEKIVENFHRKVLFFRSLVLPPVRRVSKLGNEFHMSASAYTVQVV